jgi:hypothetical protein
VALLEDVISVRPDGGEIYLVYHVPTEAIRAMTRLETDGARSIAKTDATLGVQRRSLLSRAPMGVTVG